MRTTIFGAVPVEDYVRFMEIHTRHHGKQMAERQQQGLMAYDEQLANRIRRALGDRQDITERKMFGGLAFKGFVYVSPPGFRTAAALRTWLSFGQRVAEAKAAGVRTSQTPPSNGRKR